MNFKSCQATLQQPYVDRLDGETQQLLTHCTRGDMSEAGLGESAWDISWRKDFSMLSTIVCYDSSNFAVRRYFHILACASPFLVDVV